MAVLKYKDTQTGEWKEIDNGGTDDQVLLEKIFPIGSIFMSLQNNSPANFLGGTWEPFGEGRTLIGVSSSDTDFNAPNKTGGEKTHTLTIQEMPSHKHEMQDNDSGYYAGWGTRSGWLQASANSDSGGRFGTDWEGGNQPHNNLPPYITVYMWTRTA